MVNHGMETIELATSFGRMLRIWRTERRLSQADLANTIETPPRHISFLETGRSNPSRDMVARVAAALDVPLRDRNALLKAAGFADVYRDHSLSDVEMRQLRQAVAYMIQAHNPYPSFVVDRRWNILDANENGKRMMSLVSESIPFEPPGVTANMLDAVFSSGGFRSYISNWERFARHFIQRLHREGASDEELACGLSRLHDQSDLPKDWWKFDVEHVDAPMLPVEMRIGGASMAFFTIVAGIALPTSVLAQDIKVETMFPANPETERLLREHEFFAGRPTG